MGKIITVITFFFFRVVANVNKVRYSEFYVAKNNPHYYPFLPTER